MDGTALYERAMAFDYQDAERSELMAKVWRSTPFMVDAFTGRISDDRDNEMREWCQDKWGDECLPIHGRPGTWQRGSATIFGWTWMGFATAEMLAEFELRWPDPPDTPAAVRALHETQQIQGA